MLSRDCVRSGSCVRVNVWRETHNCWIVRSRASGQLSRRSLDEAFMGAAATGHASSMVRSHTLSNPFDVGEMLNHINSSKLAGRSSSLLVRADSAGSMGGPTTLTDAANRNLKWIQPSGRHRHLTGHLHGCQ